MSKLEIRNGHIITPSEERFTSIWIDETEIVALADSSPWAGEQAQVIDAEDCYVTPGLIDLQVNGNSSCDFWKTPSKGELDSLCRDMAQSGVTSFLPTLITNDIDRLCTTTDFLIENGAGVRQEWTSVRGTARMPGIHLEGPFLSPERPGVHPPEWIKAPTIALLEPLVRDGVTLMTLAPERDDGTCIDWLKGKVWLSLGHSNATYEEARQSFDRGVTLMTHVFNALPPLHHRTPGAVGAALLDKRVTCCVIADGLHLSPPAVDLVVRTKGVDKTILVTDIAHVGTTGGGLVGSSITLDAAVRNIVEWGITDFRNAVLMATLNAARALDLHSTIGGLEPGRLADIVLWDKQSLKIRTVVSGGRVV